MRHFPGWQPIPSIIRKRRAKFEEHNQTRAKYRLSGSSGLFLVVRPKIARTTITNKYGIEVRRDQVFPVEAGPGERHDVPRLFSPEPLVLRVRGDDYTFKIKSIPLFSETSKMNAPSFSMPAGWPSSGGTCPASKLILDPKKVAICWTCYALKGRFLCGVVLSVQIGRREWAMKMLQTRSRSEYSSNGFVDAMIRSIYSYRERHPKSIDPSYFRIYDSGDFGARGQMAEAWNEIARHFSRGANRITFWAPTRDWVFLDGIAQTLDVLPVRALTAPFTAEDLGGHRPKNLVLRPSAFHVDDAPPVIAGLDAGTTVSRRETFGKDVPIIPRCGKGVLARHCHCPAYEFKGKSCVSANCRTCWEKPKVTVDYPYH